MNLTSTVLSQITVLLPITVCLGYRVFWFRWVRFWFLLGFIKIVWDNDATYQVAGTVI